MNPKDKGLQSSLWDNSDAPTTSPEASPEAPTEEPKKGQAEERRQKLAQVFCDGACSGNPGPGGYGTIVRIVSEAEIGAHPKIESETELSGDLARTTNNQMEMTGAIVGIRRAVELGATEILVQSDSEYVVKGMTSWIVGWRRKGWKTSSGQPVKNRELWEELDRLASKAKVTFRWIRGHVGHRENERCDELAVQARDRAAR